MHSSDETLVRMANQIAKFFHVQGEARAVPAIADHLKKFWEPRMKSAIIAFVEHGGKGLEPFAEKAVLELKQMYEGTTLLAADPTPPQAKVAQPSQQPKAKAKGRKASAH